MNRCSEKITLQTWAIFKSPLSERIKNYCLDIKKRLFVLSKQYGPTRLDNFLENYVISMLSNREAAILKRPS